MRNKRRLSRIFSIIGGSSLSISFYTGVFEVFIDDFLLKIKEQKVNLLIDNE